MRASFLIVGDGDGGRCAGDDGKREEVIAAAIPQCFRLEDVGQVLRVVPGDRLTGEGSDTRRIHASLSDGDFDGREGGSSCAPGERAETIRVQRTHRQDEHDPSDSPRQSRDRRGVTYGNALWLRRLRGGRCD